MILRQALINMCVFSCILSACDTTSEDTANSTDGQAKTSETAVASVGPETFEAIQKPATLDERLKVRQQILENKTRNFEGLERTPADDTDAVRGEVPDEILNKIINDLASKIGAERAEIKVLHAESLTWDDGSLGCGKPGQAYTHAQVPGYRVILGQTGQNFDYHATEHGLFILCEVPTLAVPGAGKPPVQ